MVSLKKCDKANRAKKKKKKVCLLCNMSGKNGSVGRDIFFYYFSTQTTEMHTLSVIMLYAA